MINTIAIVLGVLIALVVGLGLLFFVLNLRAKSLAILVSTVDIFPSGKSHVEFNPASQVEDLRLIKLALLYAAKIRCVQSDDNTQIAEAYEGLMDDVFFPSASSVSSDLLTRLSNAVEMMQAPDETPAATKTGERFTIRLIEGKSTDYVQSDLPFRGLAVNLPVSVLILAHAVALRIDRDSLPILERAFTGLLKSMFDGGKPRLFALSQAALDLLNAAAHAESRA